MKGKQSKLKFAIDYLKNSPWYMWVIRVSIAVGIVFLFFK